MSIAWKSIAWQKIVTQNVAICLEGFARDLRELFSHPA